MAHALLVRVVARTESALQEVLTKLRPLADHVALHEPNTVTYEFYQPDPSNGNRDGMDEDTTRRTLVIIEQYVAKTDLTATHNSSAAFKEFAGWLTNQVGVAVESVQVEHMKRRDGVRSNVASELPNDTESAPSPAVGSNGILVFCGSKTGKSPMYLHHGTRVGELILASKRPLVYGGGCVGIMGAVASTVEKGGGRVLGVIPAALAPREMSGDLIGTCTIVETMHERKQLMFSQASWLVCLPGGIGTLDELFELLTLCQLNAYRFRVGLLNSENFYGPLVAMLHHLVAQGFLEDEVVARITIRDAPDELFAAMEIADDVVASGTATALRWPKLKPNEPRAV
jgi:uncharacterized protein (TIGR00730 family)